MQALGALRSRAPKSLATISPQNPALSTPLLNPSLPQPPPNKNTKSTTPTHSSLLQPLSRHSSLFLSPPTAKIPVPYKLHKSQQKQNPPTSTHSLQEDQSLRHLYAQECATTRIALTKSVQFTGSGNSSRAKGTLSLSLSLSLSLALANLNHINCSRLQPIARRSLLLPEIQKTSRNTDATRSVDLSGFLPPIQQVKSVSNSQSSLLVCVSVDSRESSCAAEAQPQAELCSSNSSACAVQC
jgi:hypothetical protein